MIIITGIESEKGLRTMILENGSGAIQTHVLSLSGTVEDFEALERASAQVVQMLRDKALESVQDGLWLVSEEA